MSYKLNQLSKRHFVCKEKVDQVEAKIKIEIENILTKKGVDFGYVVVQDFVGDGLCVYVGEEEYPMGFSSLESVIECISSGNAKYVKDLIQPF